jgi:hypothetical protein
MIRKGFANRSSARLVTRDGRRLPRTGQQIVFWVRLDSEECRM